MSLALDALHCSNYGTPERDCPQVSMSTGLLFRGQVSPGAIVYSTSAT